MFCGKIANDSIDRVHKRAIKIELVDHESTFKFLLAKMDKANIHTQKLGSLMIEIIYKTLNSVSPPFMEEYFIRKDVKYDIRTRDTLQSPAAKGITFGIDAIKFRGSLLWNSIPDLIKRAPSATIFKRNMENWNGVECNCRIYR